MAGCSVVVLMMGFFFFAAATLSVLAALLLYTWIFESLFCAWQCRQRWGMHPVLGWLPLYNQYHIGKASGADGLGTALVLDHCTVLMLCIAGFAGAELAYGWIPVFIAVGMVLKIMTARQIYRQAAPESWKKFHLVSILTLGLAVPMCLFLLRKKLN